MGKATVGGLILHEKTFTVRSVKMFQNMPPICFLAACSRGKSEAFGERRNHLHSAYASDGATVSI